MATRLLQFIVPVECRETLERALVEREPIARWGEALDDGFRLESIVLASEKVEAILDDLDDALKADERFRALLLPVEATIPRPPEKKVESSGSDDEKSKARISREELYDDIYDVCDVNRAFLLMVALSTVIACVGILRDNVAVVIGAMIMAPLLGPNVALALATTLGDGKLARRALLANVTGAGFAFLLAVALGMTVAVNTDVWELSSRTHVDFRDIVIAVAAGVGGSIAFTTGVPASVVGVMVAVALLPPLAATGMLLGAGEWQLAYRAFLLLMINVSSVNLGGVGTFLLQGIRPASWYEKERARRAVVRAGAAWILMMLVLGAAVYLAAD